MGQMPSLLKDALQTLKNEQARFGDFNAGFYHFQHKEWKQAAAIFTHLVLKFPFEATYWKGIAASRQMEKRYDAALHAWAICALLNEDDAAPHFHAAECYQMMGDEDNREKALKCAIVRDPSLESNPIEAITYG